MQEQETLRIKNCSMNYTGPPLENFKNAKYTFLLEILFVVLILQTYSYKENTKGYTPNWYEEVFVVRNF